MDYEISIEIPSRGLLVDFWDSHSWVIELGNDFREVTDSEKYYENYCFRISVFMKIYECEGFSKYLSMIDLSRFIGFWIPHLSDLG